MEDFKTFEQWLRKKWQEESPIGDLASDYVKYLNNRAPFKAFHPPNEPLTLALLERLGACSGAIEAFKEAQKKWKAWRRRRESSAKNGLLPTQDTGAHTRSVTA